MRNIRTAAVLAAALALALALAGCGGTAPDASSTSDSSSSASASTAAQQGQAVVQINTEGLGEIAWAYEGEKVVFDDEYPVQSAYVADAYGQTIGIEAREGAGYKGYKFVKWNKDGAKFSEDKRIDVLVDGDAEYVAVFEFEGADGEDVLSLNYGDSEIYTQADIDAAFDAVTAEFDTWTGAVMKRLSFTDDATCKADLDYCNSLRKDGDPEFAQAIVITSDFHSPSGADAEGTAWKPDTDYEDWTWHLARTDGGAWKLLTWGYA